MDKSDFKSAVDLSPVPTIGVLPRTLIIRPMEYKHPAGIAVFFSGVFGNDANSKEAGDIWVATFFDRNEAEAYIMGSKTFGRPVDGVRLQLQVVKPLIDTSAVKEEKPSATGDTGPQPSKDGG